MLSEKMAMFLRMVKRSFLRGWKKKALAVITVALGTSLAVALLHTSLDIGDKVNRELKSYGANILVTPRVDTIPQDLAGVDFNPLASQSYLPESELVKLKMIFWRHNILGFAPYLQARAELPGQGPVPVVGTWFRKTLVIPTGETVSPGVRDIKSWWQVEGDWPQDGPSPAALVGREVAQRLSLKPGDSLSLAFPGRDGPGQTLPISGVLGAGGEEDRQVFVPLAWLQGVTGLRGKISQVEVSALTSPKNELARRAEADPDSLSREEFEVWYCTPYVDSVAYQIEEAIPGARAKPIRQIAEAEGAILGKVQWLMAWLALAAVAGSVLGISSLMSAAALERSREIGLLKALGAYNSSVIWLFLAEASITGLWGGLAGYPLGLGLSQWVARSVFGTSLAFRAVSLPAALAIALGVALLGSLATARLISRLEPSRILTGR